ncbi:hypothetical protein ASF56_16290 [Methylobacterium sp. Leaf122]|nr:hypothetical protein ASF56_16290 [Methylobacterium sp. Leaf122]
MKAPAIRLATENGKRVGKGARAKHLAAQPATEAARLRRCLARIRAEAERARQNAEDSEALWQAALRAACGDDPLITRAMVREACISGSVSHHFRSLARECEMAEEGTLCA